MRAQTATLVLAAFLGLSSLARAGDGIVALQSGDPSCGDDSANVYVDCRNGTVTDNRTGLIWLAHADCFGAVTWGDALDIVSVLADEPPGSAFDRNDCGLSDNSSPGEWRIPTLGEWEAMIEGAESCSPTILDDSGTGCWSDSDPGSTFVAVISDFYWSTTHLTGFPSVVWGIFLGDGNVTNAGKATPSRVWPVRAGQ